MFNYNDLYINNELHYSDSDRDTVIERAGDWLVDNIPTLTDSAITEIQDVLNNEGYFTSDEFTIEIISGTLVE